ncbi:APC family permease [Streptomyces sp. NPDC006990]|uniref:APC family permease n=1 Tax=Streptomyces sp. NPDC006990 TaxID=3154481 RepID=UPI003452C035
MAEASEEGPGPPGPGAVLPALTSEQQAALVAIGRSWEPLVAGPRVWRRALPVDPDLAAFPSRREMTPSRFARVVSMPPLPARGGPAGEGDAVRVRARRWLLGAPLRSSAFVTERMRKALALPVLAADALSSVAYGPEALLAVLVLAGAAGGGYLLPMASVIVVLMIVVGLSYRQTIRAYPHGGGSYIVAGDNLGPNAGLVAAAGLLTDYVLTVAVSVASGVAAITAALPPLHPWSAVLGVLVVMVLLAGNMRGVRQAGALFAAPTYAFLAAMAVLIAAGVGASVSGSAPAGAAQPTQAAAGASSVGVLLIVRAFSSGATAMTGIEAISNAVPVFRPVSWRNARTTLSSMIVLLVVMFTGIVVLIHLTGVVPRPHTTVLSQLAHLYFGSGGLYVFVQAATAGVLLLAANTAYNDFPRVLSLLARDDYAPKIFLRLGDRLAYTNSILLLSASAAVLLVVFGGKTAALIPLYAVGVFLSFTLSQVGMAVRWRRSAARHRRRRMALNVLGGSLTGLVLLSAAIGKFAAGAWVSLLAITGLLVITRRIHAHYAFAWSALRLRPYATVLPTAPAALPFRPTAPVRAAAVAEESEEIPEEIRHLYLIPVATLDLAAMRTLAYAASLGQPALALHISTTDEETRRFRAYWELWGDHLPLHILPSPYRAVIAPLIHYIAALHRTRPDLTLTVLLPEIVTRHRRHQFLHHRTAPRLRRALRHLPRVVVTSVPFHL